MMNETGEKIETNCETNQLSTPPLRNPVALASRRKLILSGVFKGSALAVAATPIRSLASTSSVTANGKICSISGVQSAAHSQSKGLPECGGRNGSKYQTLANWPNFNGSATPPEAINIVGTTTFSQQTAFNAVFGSGSSTPLINIIQSNPGSFESTFIVALLNSISPPSLLVFPYSPLEVISLYQDPSQSSSASLFFKDYMETH